MTGGSDASAADGGSPADSKRPPGGATASSSCCAHQLFDSITQKPWLLTSLSNLSLQSAQVAVATDVEPAAVWRTPQTLVDSDVLGPGLGGGPARRRPMQVHRCVTVLASRTQTGSEQQTSCHQVKHAGRPAAEQRVAELPAGNHLRHRLVEEALHRLVGDVGDRDQVQDPGQQAQRPPRRLQRPLAAAVLQPVLAAVDHVHAGHGEQQGEQPGAQRRAHADPGQLDVGPQPQQAVVGPAPQTPVVLDHADPPQAQLVALGGQQLRGLRQPGGHEGGGQRAEPGRPPQQDPRHLQSLNAQVHDRVQTQDPDSAGPSSPPAPPRRGGGGVLTGP